MAPARVSKIQPADTAANTYSGEEPSQPGSQGSEDDKDRVSQMAHKMMREMRGRRVKRRIDIKNAHRESMKKIEGAMTIKLDEIRRRVTHRHKQHMEKLCDLIQRRTAIEAKMLATSKKIEDAFMLADQALEFATARRLQTIEEHKRTSVA